MLTLTELEARDTPAAFVAAAHDPAFQPIPGWAGEVRVAEGDFDGNGSVDAAYAAGPDGAPRVVVYSGGRQNEPPVPSPVPGVVMVPGSGAVLFNGFVFEDSFRGGADVNVVRRPGQADLLAFVPGVGGGDRVRLIALDGSGTDLSFSAFNDPTYRGGLDAQATTVDRGVPASPHPFGLHLLVTPRAGSGGGPRAVAFDATGTKVADLIAGDPADRRGFRVLTTDVKVSAPTDPVDVRGFVVQTPDGMVAAFDWSGVRHDDTFAFPATL